MRKLFLGAVVGAVALGVTGISVAATEQTMTTTFTKNTTKTSAGVRFFTASRDDTNPKNGQPLAVRRLDLILPRGTRVQPEAVRYCKASDDELQNEGPSACPKKSSIGSGKATAKFHDPRLPDVQVAVRGFNAKGGLILHLKPDISNAFVLRPRWRGRLNRRPKLVTTVPPNCFPPATNQNGTCRDPNTGEQGEEVILNSFQLTTLARQRGTGRKRKMLMRTPRGCGAAGSWKFKVKYFYADGTGDKLTYPQACKKR